MTLTDTARDAISLQFDKFLYRTLAEALLRLGVGQDAPLPFTIRVHGSGKTALGLSTLVPQLIRRGDGAGVVLDCKGDPTFFNTVRIEASRAGRPFKWFTNRLHRSTYAFNPFMQKHLEDLTLPEYVGLFMSALDLHHGEDYGRAWFSAASRTLFQRALERLISQTKKFHAPIESFRELEETMRHLSGDEYEYRAALHLAFIVKSLSQ